MAVVSTLTSKKSQTQIFFEAEPHLSAIPEKNIRYSVSEKSSSKTTWCNFHSSIDSFDYIVRLQSLYDQDDIQNKFAKELQKFGITHFAVIETSPKRDRDIKRNVLGERMPRDWKRRYFERNYAEIDPVISETKRNPQLFLWSEVLVAHNVTRKQRRIFQEAADFSLSEGICIPIYGPRCHTAFMTLAGEKIDLDPLARATVHFMALYTYNRLSNLAETKPARIVQLTAREAECLCWAARGKTDWEIGEILSISERTAHWYIESAKSKIGVATRIQAVVAALSEGAIRI